MPWAVRVGTWVLLFILVRGTLGVVFIIRGVYRAWGTGAATVGLPQALWMLQWALAGLTLWAGTNMRQGTPPNEM